MIDDNSSFSRQKLAVMPNYMSKQSATNTNIQISQTDYTTHTSLPLNQTASKNKQIFEGFTFNFQYI